jgi:hypothetical protein
MVMPRDLLRNDTRPPATVRLPLYGSVMCVRLAKRSFCRKSWHVHLYLLITLQGLTVIASSPGAAKRDPRIARSLRSIRATLASFTSDAIPFVPRINAG